MDKTGKVRPGLRQIRILPTRSGLAWLLAMALVLLAAINYQNSLAYALAFLLAALFPVVILHTWRNLAGLTLSGGTAERTFAGGQAAFHLQLQAARHGHQAVRLGWSTDHTQTLSLAAGQQQAITLFLPARRRGWLRPGPLQLESSFPLGLARAWCRLELPLAALVCPRPLARDTPLHSSEPPGRSTDPEDYQGLRPWQPGESLRRVDWKAWSREQGLRVRDFDGPHADPGLLDFSAMSGPPELCLSRLCARLLALEARQQPYTLRLPGQCLGPDHGPRHREACLRALALFPGGAPG